MAKPIVPVVIKLLAEADSSIEGAVAGVRSALEAASKASLSSIGLSTSTVVQNAAKKLSSAFSETRVSFISESNVLKANTGILQVSEASKVLETSLDRISQRFASVAKASSDLRASKPFDQAVSKAIDLAELNKKIEQSLLAQKSSAEALGKSKPEDLVNAKAQLDKAKVVTQELIKEAAIVKSAYERAFNETSAGLTKLEKEAKKSIASVSNPVAGASAKSPAVESQREANRLQLELIKQQSRVDQSRIASENLIKKSAEDRLNLERKISDIVNQQSRNKLSGSLQTLGGLSNSAEIARNLAASQQAQLQKDVQAQLAQQKANPNSPNVQILKQTALQSRILADQLEKDAKKSEQAYTSAFIKISKEAEKALKNPTQGSSGRLGAGLGIFSPIANQISGVLDSIIGSISGSTGLFRTTAGVQIGQALSQGIGQGMAEGASFAEIGADKLLESFTKLDEPAKQLIANVGTGIVVAAAAAAFAMSGLAFVTVKIASEFEVLTAKLTTTFKDPTVAVQRFQLALELAAKTPYNVEQVVSAQVQLAALGQRNIGILQSTVDLASGLNADLARTANEVGKAAAGSLRGYQELRNTLGITQERLKEFGGVVDSQNRLLVTNEFQIRKNREALLKLIATDFGGSAARLNATLQGQISNLQDEVIKLSGAIGGNFTPTVKSAVGLTKEFFEFMNGLPPVFKTVVAGTIATVGALGVLTVGLAATSLATGVLGSTVAALTGTTLAAFIAQIPLATTAVNLLNFALNKPILTGLFGAGGLASIAFPLAALVTAVGVVNTVVTAQGEAAEAAGQRIKVYADEVANARRANISFKDDITKIFDFPKDFITDGESAQQTLEKLTKARKDYGDLGVVQKLAQAGFKTDDINERAAKESAALDAQKEKLAKLIELRKRLNEIAGNTKLSNGIQSIEAFNLGVAQDTVAAFAAANPNIQVYADGIRRVDTNIAGAIEQADKFIFQLEKTTGQLSPVVVGLKQFAESLGVVEKSYDKVLKSIVALEAPQKFALKSGDPILLTQALEEQLKTQQKITDEIEKTEGLRSESAKGTKFSIQEASKLLSGQTGAAKALLEAYIKGEEAIVDITKKRNQRALEADKFELLNIDAREKQALAIVGKSAIDQRIAIVKEAIQLEKDKADLYLSDLATYQKIQAKLNTNTLGENERQRLLQRAEILQPIIEAEKTAFNLSIENQKKLHSLEAERDTERYKGLKDRLQSFMADTKEIIKGVAPKEGLFSDKGLTLNGQQQQSFNARLKLTADEAVSAADKIKILRQRMIELNLLKDSTDFSKLGNKRDEAEKGFREAERSIREQADQARLQVPIENFKNLQLEIDKNLADSIGKADTLKTVHDSINKLVKEESLGHIRNKDYKSELNKLTAKQRDLELDIVKAVADQQKELEKIRQTRIDSEIKILEAQKGQSSEKDKILDSQIAGRKKQQIQAEFLELQAERDQELAGAAKNGKSRELILEKYAQKESELVRKAYLEHVKTEQDKLKATEDRFKKQDDILNGFKQNRVGGANSPLISVEELAFRSSLPGFGSDADSRADREKDKFKTPSQKNGSVPSFESFKTKFETENRVKLGKDGKPLPGALEDLKPLGNQSAQQIINAVINIDGKSVGDEEIVKAGADLALKSVKAAGKKSKLISGTQGGSFGSKPFGAKDFGTGVDTSFSL